MNSITSSALLLINAQNSLKALRESLKKQKTSKVMLISHYVAILLCLLITGITLFQYIYTNTKFNHIRSELYIVRKLAFYQENFVDTFNFYLDKKDLSENILLSSLYNDNWVKTNTLRIKKLNEDFINVLINDLAESESTGYTLIHNTNFISEIKKYLFIVYKPFIKIKSERTNLEMNFQNFARIYYNAINQTIDMDIKEFEKRIKNKSDDYLLFIFENFNIINEIAVKNFPFIDNILTNNFKTARLSFFYIWIGSILIIIISFIIIFPIVLKSKIKIHDTLVLFTKISIKDVDYYINHYKNLNFLFTR